MTITPERQKEFVFSSPLISFSKAAMTACKKLNKYISDIDNKHWLSKIEVVQISYLHCKN